MLSDFGISRLLINSKTLVGSTSLRGNMRWMAPELIMPVEGDELEHSGHTKATDVWAFGMVIYLRDNEVLKIMQFADIATGSVVREITIPFNPERCSSDHVRNRQKSSGQTRRRSCSWRKFQLALGLLL